MSPLWSWLGMRSRFRARIASELEPWGLPPHVQTTISAVVLQARLRDGESIELAHELASHFAEGLEAGVPEAELTAGFGAPSTLAPVLRRSVRRKRAVWDRGAEMAWHVLLGCVVAASVLYTVAIALLASRAPTIRFDLHQSLQDRLPPSEHVSPNETSTDADLRVAMTERIHRIREEARRASMAGQEAADRRDVAAAEQSLTELVSAFERASGYGTLAEWHLAMAIREQIICLTGATQAAGVTGSRPSVPAPPSLLATIEVERLFIDDFLQQHFTDDGSGDGVWIPRSAPVDLASGPVVVVLGASRREMRLAAERVLEAIEAAIGDPDHAAGVDRLESLNAMLQAEGDVRMALPLRGLLTAYRRALGQAAAAEGEEFP